MLIGVCHEELQRVYIYTDFSTKKLTNVRFNDIFPLYLHSDGMRKNAE